MAKSREGLNATTVWMIVFVGLWLASTVFLVILYTGQEALVGENNRLQANANRLISPGEERSIELVKSASEGGPTVVGAIESARVQTAQFATGEPTDLPAAIKTKRDQVLSGIQGDKIVPKADTFADVSYHEAITRLYEAYKAENQLRKAAEESAGQLKGEVDAMTAANHQLKADFEQRAKEATAQLAQCENDRSAYRTERDKTVEKIERDFDDRRKQSDIELTTERQQRQAANQRLGDLQKRFVTQQGKLGDMMPGPDKLATAREPDGRVLTAVPGDDVVYISLGSKNGLVLGLQFTVYPATTGIPADGKGKGVIEVVSSSAASAEARIVSTSPGAAILEGDLIANPIYDPNRPMTFLVLGEFDLNRDGAMDRDGGASLEALIKNWGGKTTDELSAMTDFVVVGAPPRKPKTPKDAAAEGAKIDPNDPVQRAWDNYNKTLESARSLSIPMMPQDVFLNFLGYSGRVARR